MSEATAERRSPGPFPVCRTCRAKIAPVRLEWPSAFSIKVLPNLELLPKSYYDIVCTCCRTMQRQSDTDRALSQLRVALASALLPQAGNPDGGRVNLR